jgi:GNAT superfamily N-acetyltransferase
MSPQRAAGAPAPKLVIRAVTTDDCAALAQLSTQLGYASSREDVERRLTVLLGHPGHAVFVAEAADAAGAGRASPVVVGWVHGLVKPTIESDPTIEIGGLIVAESWRGRGVGRLLMSHLERWALESGCNTITVRSQTARERAHAFYRGLGYILVKSQQVFRKTITGH